MSERTNLVTASQNRRYQRFTGVCLLGYLATLQTTLRMSPGLFRLALATLTGCFIFALLVGAGLRVLNMQDEFQRVLLQRSFVWATIVTTGLATIWGFVETYSQTTVPQVPVIFLPLILILLTAAAKVLLFRRHRSPAE